MNNMPPNLQMKKEPVHLPALFAGLTIFISCLGLFGLASFTAENRIREIGIRKVLGASVFGITQLFSRDFIKLVTISFFIAAPIAWFAMNKWLQSYTYRTPISLVDFCFGFFISMAIAFNDHQLSVGQSSNDESGEKFKERIGKYGSMGVCGDARLAVGSWRLAVGSWQLAVGGWRWLSAVNGLIKNTLK